MLQTPVHQSSLFQKVKKKLDLLGIDSSAKILVGVSGGVDSMVLLTLLKQINPDTSAAHINFQLRGNESDEDALLVRSFCAEHQIQYMELVSDTKHYAAEQKLNTQSAAREIRYNWWDKLLENSSFEWLATAHHHDDSMETLFLNLLRGTGIKGLLGIPALRGQYIRPLIDASRDEIEAFAETHCIPFRTDRSNDTDDYQRNRIRHHLIPLLRELNPDLNAVMRTEKKRMELEWKAWDNAYHHWQRDNLKMDSNGYHIKLDISDQSFLLRWLEEKDFPWSLAYDFISASHADSGKELVYELYRLSRTSDGFYFEFNEVFQPVIIQSPGTFKIGDHILTIERVPYSSFVIDSDTYVEFASLKDISWPLEVHAVTPGDYFQPLGMQGKSKKIQDYLVDIKMEPHEKKKVRILKSKEHIIWLAGLRLDERVKVNPEVNEIFRLTYKSEKGDL